MKKIVFSFLFLFAFKAFSYDAIVIVLQAPLLKEPRLNSTVLETVRQGARVYVPTEIGNLAKYPDFIQTYDRAGNVAYVPSKYIKIVTHDLSENKMPITIGHHDPTDYRLEEPIPVTYPYDNTPFLRASLGLSLGNNSKSPYDYNSVFTKQTFSSETGARLVLTHKISFDNYDRYYFGLFGSISSVRNEVYFQNGNIAEESRSLIRVGPIITFDAYKSSRYRITLGTGFTYNLHKSSIKLSDNLGQSEERLFSGYSISPFTNTLIQVVDVLPSTDLIAGADFNFFLPHNEKSVDQVTLPAVWGSDSPNQIQSGLKAQVSFFLGVQVKY